MPFEGQGMIGLARGAVKRCAHEKEWEIQARNTISRLKQILGHAMQDIQHMGSASIPSIKAKPIIDIAAAVDNFDNVLRFEKELKAAGLHCRPSARASVKGQLPFACGSCCEGTGNLRTHFIHVVRTNSTGWLNYINFRDYLNSTPSAAKEYEALKPPLARRPAAANTKEKHLAGKHDFIARTLKKARAAVQKRVPNPAQLSAARFPPPCRFAGAAVLQPKKSSIR